MCTAAGAKQREELCNMAFARSGERLKSLFSAQDMSKGAPWKRILEFSLPMLIGNLAQQMYNTADSVIVGYYVGDNALAAVGSASPILNLLLALFVGVSTGAGILVAQYYGAREKENLSNVIGNCMTLTIIVSAGYAGIYLQLVQRLPDHLLPWDPWFCRL